VKCAEIMRKMDACLLEEMEFREITEIEKHLLHCQDCRSYKNSLTKETQLFKQAISASPLPDQFVDTIMGQLEDVSIEPKQGVPSSDLAASQPRPVPTRSRKNLRWKAITGYASAILLLSGVAGMYVSPTFAAYVSSFVSRVSGDLGLKFAAENGYNTAVNQTVSDQGYTLRVKDIVADSARLVITYTLEDASGNPLDDQYLHYFDGSKIYLADKAGNVLSELPEDHELGPGYGDITFVLDEWPKDEDIVVHFDVHEIGVRDPKPVNFALQIPVNIAESKKAATTIPVQYVFTSPQGIRFSFDQVMYAPSATRFEITTSVTDEAYERERQLVREMEGDDADFTMDDSYRFSYRIVNQTGEVVAASERGEKNSGRTLYFSPTYPNGENVKTGTIQWKTAIIPGEPSETLTFILDEIEKEERADFAISIRPDALLQSPVTKTNEETGDTYTIKGLKKGIYPGTNEEIWVMTIEGNLKIWDMPSWILSDGTGNRYEVTPDYTTMTVRHTKEGEILKQDLFIKEMATPPEELSLKLKTYKKRYTNIDWKVPIPPQK